MDSENEEKDDVELNVDDLFKDPDEEEPAVSEKPPVETDIMTKAVSERISEVKRKTEQETKDNLAKELGYDNYKEMTKDHEKKLLKNAGLDDEEIEKVVTKLVEKRLASDPRLKKLEEYETLEKEKFVDAELKAINKLTESNFTSISQLPKETLAMWEKTGNLKQAYLATQGEAIITKGLSAAKNGSLNHLANSSNSSSVKQRVLTEEEKAIWKATIPEITDEELAKKTMPIS